MADLDRAGAVPGLPAGVDPFALVRRYEPVVRYTAGELFFPMSVDAYVRGASLWSVESSTGRHAVLVVRRGDLDLDVLCAQARSRPTAQLQVRYAGSALDRRRLRAWRRDPTRPRLRSTSRFAAVGLFGRLLDSLFRLSLVLRGRVPGGLVAAAHEAYRASAAAEQHPYYAHVSADGGYVVVQYWFFYAMNDWRTSFSGVNDHEADWEQVTVFLAPTDGAEGRAASSPDGADVLAPAWLAFSSHDEVGADLRRRVDDPDIGWVGGTHPVVHAGAGSHSGAYLAGEYLVRVEPPAFQRLFSTAARLRELVFPWTRDRARTGFGIPYVDYRRGDGVHLGPGTDRPWSPVLVDASTPWVRDYAGLWGLDTDDPFGGERAPAGPRYERDATVRASWRDPVAWAALDTVPPAPLARAESQAARVAELVRLRADLTERIRTQQEVARRVAAASPVLPRVSTARRRESAGGAAVAEQVRLLDELRAARRAADVELDRLGADPPPAAAPHDHLRHRAVPDIDPATAPGVLLRFWTEASLSVLLAVLGVALLLNLRALPQVLLGAVLAVMAVEAVLRRRLLVFLLGVLVVAGLVLVLWLLVTNWRDGLAVLCLAAAVAIGVGNLRALLFRR